MRSIDDLKRVADYVKVSTIEDAKTMFEELTNNILTDRDITFVFYSAIATIYEVGRQDGIRQERAKKKIKG